MSTEETLSYKLIERPSDEFYTIQLTCEKYSDIKYRYGRVNINESEGDEDLTINFDWALVDYNKSRDIQKELVDNPEFNTHLGKILRELLIEFNQWAEEKPNE